MSQVTVDIDEDAIRAKAYELWQLRGCPEGGAEDDWERAERLLREEAAERKQTRSHPRSDPEVPEPFVAGDDETTLPTGMPAPVLPEVAVESEPKPSTKRSAKRRSNRRR
jgi:hypothetical protein